MQIDERLNVILGRVGEAAVRSGRAAADVTLVAVSKTFLITAVEVALAAGQVDFGENKVQELVQKSSHLPGHANGGPVRWHMIGHLQRNKAVDVARHADLFHAVDSVRLARALDTRCAALDRVLPCLVQVNVSGEASKFGVDPAALFPLLEELKQFESLSVTGLMTLASPAADPEDIRPQFRLLRELASEYNSTRAPATLLRHLSMGMSGDFEVAIEEGATHVRIGSAIFGSRTYS